MLVTQTAVTTIASNTDWFEITNVLKPGSILSPILLNVVMVIILREVKKENGNVNAWMFADDIVLWGKDINELQAQLNTWNRLMKVRGLNISKEKRI